MTTHDKKGVPDDALRTAQLPTADEVRTMNVTVYGPNLPGNTDTFHVHRTGCADITRGMYRRLGVDQGGWNVDVASVIDLVTAVYDPSDFDYEPSDEGEIGPYENDIRIFPCVDLPRVTGGQS